MPGCSQSSCGTSGQTSHVLWRRSPFDLSEFLAGQLRTKACNVDAHMKLLGSAAMRYVEEHVSIATALSVREQRLDRFPSWRGRIKLDYRTAWDASTWTAFVESFGSSSSDSDDVDDIAKIDALFADELPPLKIIYGGCCDTDENAFDTDNYKLQVSTAGDWLCLDNCLTWPSPCCSNGCGSTRVRYIAGYATANDLADAEPGLMHNILATFGYLYENPELVSPSGDLDNSAMMKMRLGIKWR